MLTSTSQGKHGKGKKQNKRDVAHEEDAEEIVAREPHQYALSLPAALTMLTSDSQGKGKKKTKAN